MPRMNVYDLPFAKVYPAIVNKALKKGRTKEEVDELIEWLTGYNMKEVDIDVKYGDFFKNAPSFNPNASLIKGTICGIRVENIEDPIIQRMRYLDKLIDELSKGKQIENIKRK